MAKKILVTGAAGFVGKRLVRILIDRGYEVSAMVRENTKTDDLEVAGARIIYGDLRVKESLYPALEGIDTVVHLATTMKGPWEEYQESTVNGTRRLLEICEEKKIGKFIFLSSISVYDVAKLPAESIKEDAPLISQNPSLYEKSKILTEQVVLEFSRRGVPAVILRSGVIYGPGGPVYPPRLGLNFGANCALVIGDGQNRIPLVYLDNLIEGVICSLERVEGNGEIYNIVDDQVLSQLNYLNSIKEKCSPRLKIIFVRHKLARVKNKFFTLLFKLLKRPSPIRDVYLDICAHQIVYSNQKAKERLGWHPPVEPQEALTRTTEWFKKKAANPRIVDVKALRNFQLSRPLNVAIIGCGVIAKTHLDILKKIKGITVVGLCDNNLEVAKKLSAEYGRIPAFNNVEDMLSKNRVDAVHILTPPQGRRELVAIAARHKCHIFLEKPMALNAEEGRAMLEAAQRNGVQICLGHNHLFDPQMVEARKIINKGLLGEIVYVESWYGFNLGANLGSRYMIPGAEKHWSMQLPGKLYQNLISHPISVLTDVMGYPTAIKAATISGHVVKSMKHDELKVMLEGNGKAGLLTVSLAVNPRYQFLNVYGTNACLYVDFLNKTLFLHSTPKMIPKAISRALISLSTARILTFATLRNFFKVLTKQFTYFDGTEVLIKEFYKSLLEGGEMPVSGEDGLKSMEIMDEIWKQIEL